MKRLRFLPALLLILGACSENIIEQGDNIPGEMGTVSIALDTDMTTGDVVTKADGDVPNVDDFWLSIYKVETQMRLYSDRYVNTKDKEIRLNAGEYRLVAQHGDSLGCGFDKPYYMADPTFTVKGGKTKVDAVAKLANVKMAVIYSDLLKEEHSDYYTVVKHQKYTSKKLTFSSNETRCGYMPGGEVVLQVYAIVDGDWKYYQTNPLTYNPNDFVTFNITTDTSKGNLVINIKVDGTVEDKNESVTIPAIAAPQDAPVITLAGFNGENVHEFVEGVTEGANATASFIARGSLSHCYLTVESEYLAKKGVPSQLDFANLTADQKATLKAAGFAWDENMSTSRKLSFINFSGLISKMLANTLSAAEDVEMAKFTLKVEDSVAKTAESTFSIVSASVKPTLVINDYDVWATKMVNTTYSINKGRMSLLRLQTSTDNFTWANVGGTPVQDNYTYVYENISLNPSTTYYVRAIYNDNPVCVSPVVEIRTEDALSLENGGFNSWIKPVHEYSQGTREWYRPWADNAGGWWDVNSKKTLVASTSAAYQDYKCVPTVYMVAGAEGSYAAQLVTTAVRWGANDWGLGAGDDIRAAGEIFIGKADNSGNHESEGHAFASRPTSLSLQYKYDSYENDTFFVHIDVKDENGSVIGSGEITNGAAASSWKTLTLPLNYTVKNKKASSIYIRIRSSKSADGDVQVRKTAVPNVGKNGYIGSVLIVDDLKLNY